MRWTPEALDALDALYGRRSAYDIARLLGCSRNAVIGKANRLGLRVSASDRKRLHRERTALPPVSGVPFKKAMLEGLCQFPLNCRDVSAPYVEACGKAVRPGTAYCEECGARTRRKRRR